MRSNESRRAPTGYPIATTPSGQALSHQGWPFLIGRGVQVGNQILLAPAHLDRPEIVRLAQLATPPSDSPHTEHLVGGEFNGDYTVVFQARAVLRSDVQLPTDSGAALEPFYDEHSRPIEVLTGFVVDGRYIIDVSSRDLTTAWAESLDVYRRFLADEQSFRVARSSPFPLTSPVTVDGPAAVAESDPQSRDRSLRSVLRIPAALGFVALLIAAFLLWNSTPSDGLRLEEISADCGDFTGRLGQACELRLASRESTHLEVTTAPANALESYKLLDDCKTEQPDQTWSCTIAIEGGGSDELQRLEVVVKSKSTGDTVTVSLPTNS